MGRISGPCSVQPIARRLALAAAILGGGLGGPAVAQTLTVELPRSVVLTNYDRVPLGQREGLEGGAFVARTDDAAAAWYNPAGLVQSEKSGLNASATAYEWTTFEVDGFGTAASRSRLNTMSTLVSGVIGAPLVPAKWRLGFAIARPVSWRPGALDEAVEVETEDSYEHYTYKALSDLSTQVLRAAVGWQTASRLRLGAGMDVSVTSLGLDQGITDHLTRGGNAKTIMRRLHTEGTTYHLLGTLGLQWDPHPNWNAGVCVTTPGLRLRGRSTINYEAGSAEESSDAYLSLRDEEARFEYRQPTKVTAGLACNLPRGSLEADIRWHDSTDEYDIYQTDEVGRLTVDTVGQPVENSEVAFAPTKYSARSVVNFALGGRYLLSRSWVLHAGFFTDNSPVANSDHAFFPKIDLVGGIVGATLSGDNLSGSLGVGYASGTSSESVIIGLVDGGTTTGRFRVRTISLNYAISYAF